MIRAQVTLVGNLGEVESQYTPAGKRVTSTSLAVNFGSRDNQETDWYRIVAWEKTAEFLYKYAKKGTKILITGRQRIKKWTKDGKEHTQIEVTVQDFEVIARGRKDEEAPEGEDVPDYMKD